MARGGGGRSGGGGGGGFRPSGGFRSSGASKARKNAVKPASSPAPPPAPRQDGNAPAMGGFAASIVDGLSFGFGSSVAHRVSDFIFGPRVFHHTTAAEPAPAATPPPNTNSFSDACGGQAKAFQDCLNKSASDIGKCQFYVDMLRECQGIKA